jgi:hypothetical protein
MFCVGAMPVANGDETRCPGDMGGSISFQPLTGIIMRNGQMVSSITDSVIDKINNSITGLKIGIGFEFISSQTYSFFTVNDQEIAKMIFEVPPGGVFPTVVIQHRQVTTVSVDNNICKLTFPQSWPCFNPSCAPVGVARISEGLVTSETGVFTKYKESTKGLQGCFPLSSHRRYFEVIPCSKMSISIGVASMGAPLNEHVGTTRHSLGYQVDSGHVISDGTLVGCTPVHNYPGVVIGCGAVFPSDGSRGNADMFFTINGVLVSKHQVIVPVSGLFPTLCISGNGICELNLTAPCPLPDMKYSNDWSLLNNVVPSRNSLELISHAHIGLAQSTITASVDSPVYFTIKQPPSSKNSGKILIGFSNCNESPFNPKVTGTNRSYFLELSTGSAIMIHNGTRHSEDISIPKGTACIGCGVLPLSRFSLIFFTADKRVIFADKVPSHFSTQLHPTVCMVGTTHKVELDMCALWPPPSPVGNGWSRHNNILFKNGIHTTPLIADKDLGFLQGACPLLPGRSYFEVEIVRRMTKKAIAIGLSSYKYRHNQWVGWKQDSIAYHVDDGNLFKSFGMGVAFGPKLHDGDVVGCGILFPPDYEVARVFKGKHRVEVMFTVNGQRVGKVEAMTIPEGGLFPTVCLESNTELVHVSFEEQYLSNIAKLGKAWSRGYSIRQVGSLLKHAHSSDTKLLPFPLAFIQGRDPFSESYNYFEMEVLNCQASSTISIGIASLQSIDATAISSEAVTFSLNGTITTHNITGKGKLTHSRHRCGIGDVVGCFCSVNLVRFYHNNVQVMVVPLQGNLLKTPLHPTIVLSHPGDVVLPRLHAPPPSNILQQPIGWLRYQRVKFKGSVVEYNCPAPVENANNVGVIQTNQSFNRHNSFFEIKILNLGESSTIAIGAAALDYPLNDQPGWVGGSIGYHGDDGRLFNVSGSGCCFGPTWNKYDVIGLGMRSYDKDILPGTDVQVFFTYNGREVGHTTAVVPPSGFFPTVGLHSQGEMINLYQNVHQSNTRVQSYLKWRTLIGINMERSYDAGYVLKFSNMKRQVPDTVGSRTPGLGLAVSYEAFSSDLAYFEVELLHVGHLNAIAIGATSKDYSPDDVPGWVDGSIAYHTDSGCIHAASGKGKIFGPIAAKGDVIGCGFAQSLTSTRHCNIFYTLNGVLMGHRVQVAIPDGGIYPAVGLVSPKDKVCVRFKKEYKPPHSISQMPVGLMRIHNCSYSENVVFFNGGIGQGSANAQFAVPLNTTCNYFTANVLVLNDPVKIGLAPRDFPLSHAPGMSSYSISYDIKIGIIKGVFGHVVKSIKVSKCSIGDVVGCGILLVDSDSESSDKKKSSYHAFFTRNKDVLHQMELVDLNDDIFPIIGFVPENKMSAVYMDWSCTSFEPFNVL